MQRLRIETPGDGDDLRIEYDPEGEFVRADEAIDLLNKHNTQALHLAGAIMLLKRFAQHELPEHEDANEDDVTLVMGHIDHEHYRHSVRLAKEFLTSEVNAVR